MYTIHDPTTHYKKRARRYKTRACSVSPMYTIHDPTTHYKKRARRLQDTCV